MTILLSIIGHTSGFFTLIVIFMAPFVWFITGRHFDKHYDFKNMKNPIVNALGIWPKGFLRAAQYSAMIFFNGGMRRSMGRIIYHNADFRQYARKIDWVIAILTWGSFCISCFLSLLYLFLWVGLWLFS